MTAGIRLAPAPAMPGRRPGSRDDGDRRLLRGVAAVLCLALALYCLAAAGLTITWPAAAGELEVRKAVPVASRLSPLVIPAMLVVYLLVVGAALRRPGTRPTTRPVMTGQTRAAG